MEKLSIGGMFMNPFATFTPKIITFDNFIPTDEDIFIQAGDDRQRLIFGEPLEFTDEEKEKIKEFEQYIADNQLELPAGYDFREWYRYYQGWGFNAKNAYEGILENHQFIQDNIPVNMDGLDEYLQKMGWSTSTNETSISDRYWSSMWKPSLIQKLMTRHCSEQPLQLCITHWNMELDQEQSRTGSWS